MKLLRVLIAAIFLCSIPAHADFDLATSLTGGGEGSLDSIDGVLLNEADGAIVITNGITYTYYLDATSGAGESSPDIISPDANAGTKRWILQGFLSSPSEIWDANAHPILTITAAHANAYDPQIQFRTDASPSVKYSMGVDGADDKLKIASGSGGIGGSTEFIIDHIGGTVEMNSDVSTTLWIGAWSNNVQDNPTLKQKRGRGTEASPLAVVDDDVIGEWTAYGWDGDSFSRGARIYMYVDNTPGDGSMPSRISFETSNDGSDTPSIRMIITSSANPRTQGSVGIGNFLDSADIIDQLHLMDGSANEDVLVRVQNDVQTWKFGVFGQDGDSFKIHDVNNTADMFSIDPAGGIDLRPFDDAVNIHHDGDLTLLMRSWSNDVEDNPTTEYRRGRGTEASPLIVEDDDVLGEWTAYGWDSNSFARGARIAMFVDDTPGDESMPGRIQFEVTNTGSVTPSVRMILTHSNNPRTQGTLGIGNFTSSAHIIDQLHLRDGSADEDVLVRVENDAQVWKFGVFGQDSDKFKIHDVSNTSDRYVIDTAGNHDFVAGNMATTGIVTGGVGTVTDPNGFTMTATQGLGYVVYATGAGTIVMPPAVAGSNFTVEAHAAAAVVLDPDASGTEDTIRLNGTALAQGAAITSTSTAGDLASCTYFAADTWSCMAIGWTGP